MSQPESSFSTLFKALTNHAPFPWQQKLYTQFISDDADNIPAVCSIPTGLGKTSVVAVWLIARSQRPDKLPRRLAYVVNRRTVVDQTTNEAIKLRDNAGKIGIDNLAISTLRGQFADNQEWSTDPSRPAVICGTVDMIGSRLLFSGYRIGFKSRPLHAGFLGQDTLLVHDEAHLEPAFQTLIKSIESEQKQGEKTGILPWPKLRVMALSATTRGDDNGVKTEEHNACQLTDAEKKPPDIIPDPPTEPVHYVWRRLTAKKALTLHEVDDAKDAIAKKIAALAGEKYKDANAAVLIFARTLHDVETIAKELSKTKRSVVLLTGTMRGKERDELVDTADFKRFLNASEPRETTVYLVCTSAGEVGVNLSADHMVCDLSTLDSMIQRLGRVNRFGEPIGHVANIDVVHPNSFGKRDKQTGELKADEIDIRRALTLDLLKMLPSFGDHSCDASPKALGDLQQRTDLPGKIEDRFAPSPTILPATDILFDAWAMTTIRGEMPGRPPVAPYLHGIADDLPQTTIAWRTELDLIDMKSPDANKVLHALFSKHRIRPHETLTTNSYRVVDFLKKVVKKRPELRDRGVAIQLVRGPRVATVGELIDDSSLLNANPTLILPASFGGLDRRGMLAADIVPKKTESDHADAVTTGSSLPSLDIADNDDYELHEGVTPRIRILITQTDDGWSFRPMPGGKPLPKSWQLERIYKTSTILINQIRKQSHLNVRLVVPIASDDEGNPVRSLVCFSPSLPHQPKQEQSLQEHVARVEREADQIVKTLKLEEPFRSALLFAAKWHDEGKKAKRWQDYIGGPDARGQMLGKSAEWRDPKRLAGYRHEFGSLLRIPDKAQSYFSDSERILTAQQQDDACDLALHMIAAHHGYARPHFVHPFDDDFNARDCEQMQIDVMRRYARLQRQYGRWGLVYLESLLRAADAAASETVGFEPDADDDPTEIEGGET